MSARRPPSASTRRDAPIQARRRRRTSVMLVSAIILVALTVGIAGAARTLGDAPHAAATTATRGGDDGTDADRASASTDPATGADLLTQIDRILQSPGVDAAAPEAVALADARADADAGSTDGQATLSSAATALAGAIADRDSGVFNDYADAAKPTEDALAAALSALREAALSALPDALAAADTATTAVITDAKAYRQQLIAASAGTNSQPTDGDVHAQLDYLMAHVDDYNSEQWGNYNPYGGDCANFVSQGLLARGWHADATWFSHGKMWTASKPWIATGALANYFDTLGLTYSTEKDLDRVRVGDVGVFAWGELHGSLDHTMTVSKVEYTADGPVVYFVSHNKDGKYRELRSALYEEHSNSTARIYHIP